MDALETVYIYIYLEQVITMNGSIIKDINNKVQLAWRAFGKKKKKKPLFLKVASQFV